MNKTIATLFLIFNFFLIISNTTALEVYVITDSHNVPELDCEAQLELSARTGRMIDSSCLKEDWLLSKIKSIFKFILTIGLATALAFGMGKSADRISEEKSWSLRFLNLLLFFLLLSIVITTLILDWLFIKYGTYWWSFVVTLLYFSAFVLRVIFLDYKSNHRGDKATYNPQSKIKPLKGIETDAVISQSALSTYLKEDLLILAKYYKVKCDDKDTKSIIKKKIASEMEIKFSKSELFSKDKTVIFGFFKDLKSMYNENRTRHGFNFKKMISKVEKHWSKL